MNCSCGCDREAVKHRDRDDLSETCFKRWASQGRPAGPMSPPRARVVRDQAGQPMEALPDGTCGCGRCGLAAVKPAGKPVLSETCYRRSLRLGLGGYVCPPPPLPPSAPKPRVRHPRPKKPEPEPVVEGFSIGDFRAAEVLRRIPGELLRARGYAHAVARSDWLGADMVFARVKDIDAFDAVLDAGLDETKARAALADQLTREFPDIRQDEEETAA